MHPERLRAHAAGRRGRDGPPAQAGSSFQRSLAPSHLVPCRQLEVLVAVVARVLLPGDLIRREALVLALSGARDRSELFALRRVGMGGRGAAVSDTTANSADVPQGGRAAAALAA